MDLKQAGDCGFGTVVGELHPTGFCFLAILCRLALYI